MSKEKRIVDVGALVSEGKDIIIDYETKMGIFKIRPLALGEIGQIKALKSRGVKTSATAVSGKDGKNEPKDATANVDNELVTKGVWEAKFAVLAFGLSVDNQRYNPETIKKLKIPLSIMEDIHAKIIEITEVGVEDVKPFSDDVGRAENGNVDTDGIQTGIDNRESNGSPS